MVPAPSKWTIWFTDSSSVTALSAARRLVLSTHMITWHSWVNASLVHSIRANTFTPFTRIVAAKVRTDKTPEVGGKKHNHQKTEHRRTDHLTVHLRGKIPWTPSCDISWELSWGALAGLKTGKIDPCGHALYNRGASECARKGAIPVVFPHGHPLSAPSRALLVAL